MRINVRTLGCFSRETNFSSIWEENNYTQMNIWITGRNFKRQTFQQKMHFTAS